jgi:hypothetical protein
MRALGQTLDNRFLAGKIRIPQFTKCRHKTGLGRRLPEDRHAPKGEQQQDKQLLHALPEQGVYL